MACHACQNPFKFQRELQLVDTRRSAPLHYRATGQAFRPLCRDGVTDDKLLPASLDQSTSHGAYDNIQTLAAAARMTLCTAAQTSAAGLSSAFRLLLLHQQMHTRAASPDATCRCADACIASSSLVHHA